MAHGQLFARFAVRNGATRLIEHRQNAPLKIARVFESETRCGGLEVCVMDASPGLLAGDRHDSEWILEAGAQVRITTQGATRVHPTKNEGVHREPSRQTLMARVKSGARLELWPEAIIPFRDSIFQLQNRIWLEEGAQFSTFECLSAGRIARGEQFAFQRVSLQTQVFDERGPLFCAQNRFVPAEAEMTSRFCFGNATHWASLVAFGESKKAAVSAQKILEDSHLYGAASLLECGGVAVSILAPRAYDARSAALKIEADWSVSRETI